jgi:uncharacterized protein (TIGR00369 family)
MTDMPATSAEAFATMTGRDLLQAMLEGQLDGPGIGGTLSFTLTEVGEGLAVFEGETGPHLLNPAGTVHGGWALALIDSAAGCAAHSLLPAGVGYSTLETRCNFVRPIRVDTGRVRCEGRVVNQGRQIITADAWVRDAEGRLLAHGGSTLMVLPLR